MDKNGNWWYQSELREFNGDGNLNPLFNHDTAKILITKKVVSKAIGGIQKFVGAISNGVKNNPYTMN